MIQLRKKIYVKCTCFKLKLLGYILTRKTATYSYVTQPNMELDPVVIKGVG